MAEQFDVVRLKYGLPEEGLPAGTEAVVLDVYDKPVPGYEIEVSDESGLTVFLGGVRADEVEVV